ncbi:MAG: carbamoyltransferase [Candidatus Omnitrophica bacterium]|nr:carbamoyltransferase [Candidatus Omnitrophota bacterium]
MNILGISCFYHDSAACLVQDGEIIAAAQEERFTRKKHDFNFPLNAINWCLKDNGLSGAGLDLVVFYDKPWVKFERIIETSVACAPGGFRHFIQDMPLWLKQKLWIPELIRKELKYKGKILFSEHHESHAASAFYPSPFSEAAFLTMDGAGEWETASFGVGRNNDLKIQYYLRFPHSLGLLYSAFTHYTGFKVNSGEYKLMGLSPYGEPKYADLILDKLIDLKDDGSFRMNMEYFGYCNSLKMTNPRFERLFGGRARIPETKITQQGMDIAASIQKVTEEIMLRMSRHVHTVTGQEKLCIAGGVALNCVGNGRILREGPFKEVWVQPSSSDAGGALGAALLAWYKYLGNKRNSDDVRDTQKASLLGPSFSDAEIESFLEKSEVPYKKLVTQDLISVVAELIAQGKVVGWFQGRMEFGPRALGSRSILGDARSPEMQSRMNLKIKYRESFRPFAPAVLEEKASEWFDFEGESPYMLLAAPVRKEKRLGSEGAKESLSGFEKLKLRRSLIPAVTHVDYSCRLQTVKREDNPLYYDLINEFYKKTGCPVIINTSFNVRGEPLVCTPQEAFDCFMRTEMDYLAMGPFLLDKNEQGAAEKDKEWQKVFELD